MNDLLENAICLKQGFGHYKTKWWFRHVPVCITLAAKLGRKNSYRNEIIVINPKECNQNSLFPKIDSKLSITTDIQ